MANNLGWVDWQTPYHTSNWRFQSLIMIPSSVLSMPLFNIEEEDPFNPSHLNASRRRSKKAILRTWTMIGDLRNGPRIFATFVHIFLLLHNYMHNWYSYRDWYIRKHLGCNSDSLHLRKSKTWHDVDPVSHVQGKYKDHTNDSDHKNLSHTNALKRLTLLKKFVNFELNWCINY